MKIVGTAKTGPEPGDFGATIKDNWLILPEEVAEQLRRLSIDTAEELLSYASTFPTSVARQLHWSVQDVNRAASRLTLALEGHVDHDLLHPTSAEEHGFGALDPSDFDPVKHSR